MPASKTIKLFSKQRMFGEIPNGKQFQVSHSADIWTKQDSTLATSNMGESMIMAWHDDVRVTV